MRLAHAVRAIVAALAVVGTAACNFKSLDFMCTSDADCALSGMHGTCEAVGYCSFPDATCSEGNRFTDNSGAYTGLCVGAGPAGSDGGLPPVDASDASDTIDANVSASCWDAWKQGTIAFAPPTAITELANAAEQAHPSLSDDFTLYFDRTVPGRARDFYVTTRAGYGMPWGSATPVTELNTTLDEERVTVTADGTYAVLATTRGGGSAALWTAARAGATGAFSTPTQTDVAAVDSSPVEFDPQLSPDGLHVYFAPTQVGGKQVIAFASRTSTAVPFTGPVTISELSITNTVSDPVISPDELVILFSSPNGAAQSLYFAVRATTGSPFGTPKLIPDINTGNYNANGAVSSTGCELFFTSSRGGAKALYRASVN